ncbi:MAG TPA: carboxymuconolactone decarboxylase family protein [Dehalococcoidales bacterium]|nr:carboxymuconolactone decarboxylase family protein [Dehalococcoidales bacterium]
MESQVKLNDARLKLLEKYKQSLPDLIVPESAKWDVVYKDGALSTKVKRLIAMAMALGVGCTNCILGQTRRAVDAGATKEEFLETLSVVSAMRGTTGMAESLRVIQFLEELGKL